MDESKSKSRRPMIGSSGRRRRLWLTMVGRVRELTTLQQLSISNDSVEPSQGGQQNVDKCKGCMCFLDSRKAVSPVGDWQNSKHQFQSF